MLQLDKGNVKPGSSDILRRPQNWDIFQKFCGPLRKPELYYPQLFNLMCK